ncbi:hypothetical protein [Oceanitalea stevensii]|uniref:SurA N-terminal domain-containing protein n=1 Tax=Oceanitalea stevensii TaxID=2763072 RepID=A0ABR8Z2I4_9MICO|nr:hypothetical protein [Oceanitalea stevensii]MBD8062542.1 hypothetical protein [Oceanitalea stevensii]
MTSTRLSRGIAAATLLTALALGGCSAHPGAAAVVDGERITEAELARAVSDFAAVTGQQVDSVAMLGTLVVAPVLIEVGAEHGVGASEDEAVALLDQQAEVSGLTAPEDGYGSGVIDVARMTLVNQRLAAAPEGAAATQAITERISEAEVEVSPRYGEFDPSGQIVPQALPWIATTTPPATPLG